ncbi:EAL domain-containing protein [Rhodopila sp.]|uniref:EAL domain-containing protein n=1 Tax=Rhodopila sp. TaxID=2480087 RepID=UPI002B8B5FE5|nr:EAL domain-containing protein [Rhodopila sp.]HVZ07601.1 EAL domain-containing protein [Rhodopila sp.]
MPEGPSPEGSRHDGQSADADDLAEIVRRAPIGLLSFDTAGMVLMINPSARALLYPLLPDTPLENVFTGLAAICPDLMEKVAGFTAPSGTILDQRQLRAVAGAHAVTLSLSVSRLRPGLHLAVVRDLTRLNDMIAFAFASADVLIDLDPDGTIRWAGGAVSTVFDMPSRDAVGRQLCSLIAPRDREALARALAVIASRGRLAPLLLGVANAAESRHVLSGMLVDGPAPRYLLTLAPPPDGKVSSLPWVRGGRDFQIEAANWLKAGQAGVMGLLDVKGLDATHRGALTHMIGRLAAETGGDHVVLGEISDGRFGILGPGPIDMAQLSRSLSGLVGSSLGGTAAEVRQTTIDLNAGLLSISQSVQALRLALSRFGSGGIDGVEALGGAKGLSGIIEQVSTRKRALAARITGSRFTLAYQPVVSLRDRQIHHYEALLRLPPDASDAMGTQDFVTMVEALGLSPDLDLAVLRRAVRAIRRTGASIAVNVSGRSIVSPTFVQKLLAELVGLPPRRLLVEITETVEIEDMAAAAMQVDRLRAALVAVCLDDFGAGSASFRYVRDLRVDYLKIDGAFVRSASEGQQGRSFVRAMQDMAASSKAETIAEMVETEEDVSLMLELGVQYGQGFLFGRPGPIPGGDAPDGVAAGSARLGVEQPGR